MWVFEVLNRQGLLENSEKSGLILIKSFLKPTEAEGYRRRCGFLETSKSYPRKGIGGTDHLPNKKALTRKNEGFFIFGEREGSSRESYRISGA
jgi:hypothetical protein